MSALPELIKFGWPALLIMGVLAVALMHGRSVDEEGMMAPNWGSAGVWLIVVLVICVAVPFLYTVLKSPEPWGVSQPDPGRDQTLYDIFGAGR